MPALMESIPHGGASTSLNDSRSEATKFREADARSHDKVVRHLVILPKDCF